MIKVHGSTDYVITSLIISVITDTEYLYFYKMKTFKISCRKVKISEKCEIRPGVEICSFQPEVKGTCISKTSHPGVNFTSPMCNMPVSPLESKICKMTNLHTAGHFERELHLFSQNQRLKQTPSQKFLTDSPVGF